MQPKVIAAFIAGIVVCSGVIGGGIASAQSHSIASHRQINVKLEWVGTHSSGAKSVDSLLLIADSGQRAGSHNSTSRDKMQIEQDAHVTATLNSDNTATLVLDCNLQRTGEESTSQSCDTTLTVGLGETKVVRSFVRKNGSESSETLLFVTATAQ